MKQQEFQVGDILINCTTGHKFKVIKKHNLHYESRLFNTIPRNYVMRYQKAMKYFEKNTEQNFNMNDEQIEFNLRCHILVDYISGMTDDFALERYPTLNTFRGG